MVKKEVIVRAYDLGGFGDIAGALRVTDYLARQGRNVGILPMSDSARQKLNTLAPEYPQTVNDKNELKAEIVVDVAGHYQDNRILDQLPTPHLFIEDMDNSSDRSPKVPLYIKTGLVDKGVSTQIKECGITSNPLFYRPFAEEEIPDKKNLNPLELILVQLSRKVQKLQTKLASTAIEDISEVGFAHFRPNAGTSILRANYIKTLKEAAKNCHSKRFAVGLFITKNEETSVIREAEENEDLNFVSPYHIAMKDPNFLTLVMLGPTPQLETSKMFLSANIPPQVTGDLSLSDAIYFLLTREGQGFFYDCPGWKEPTKREIERIFDQHTKDIFNYEKGQIDVFTDEKKREEYRKNSRETFIKEISRRFGDKTTFDEKIPKKMPFIFQDAAGLTIDKLLTDKEFKEKVEKQREKIANPRETYKTQQEEKTTLEPDYKNLPTQKAELVEYDGLQIEKIALPYDCGGCNPKKLITYDQSSERIKKSGLQRHLRSPEAFKIIIEGLEGKLIGKQKEIFENMLKSYGEWLSNAMERHENTLIIYSDPEGLIWDRNTSRYVKKDFKYSDAKEFKIKEKWITTKFWEKINQIPEEIVEHLYGRKFKKLPKEMQERAYIYVSFDNNIIWPVARSHYNVSYYVNACSFNYWASRAVAVV